MTLTAKEYYFACESAYQQLDNKLITDEQHIKILADLRKLYERGL